MSRYFRLALILLFLGILTQYGCGPARRVRVRHRHPSEIEAAAQGDDLEDLHEILFGAVENYKGVQDYRCIFLKRQMMGDELQGRQRILLKYREPMSVYMKWLAEPHKGQEILYVPDRYGEKGYARAGGWFGKVTPLIRVDVDGYWVMRDNIRPLNDIGIGRFLDIFMENFHRADKADDGALIDRGESVVEGRRVKVIEAVLPPDESEGYYCYRSVLHFDKEHGLPVKMEIYDWHNRLREEYIYKDLELNVGLEDKDFDLENREYKFR